MKKVLSTILTLSLCIILLCFAAAAFMMGDVDGNGQLQAADARMALRASVGLDKLTEQQQKAADADSDGVVKAADARLILRASVGLEQLHVHSFTGTITTKPTCSAEGVKTFTCACGKGTYTEPVAKTDHIYGSGVITTAPTCAKEGVKTFACTYGCGKAKTEAIEKTAHKYTYKITKQATCTADGAREIRCTGCSFLKQETIKAQHQFKNVSLTASTKCSATGCNVVLPAFNDIVNPLKDSKNGLNYFTGIQEDISYAAKPETGGLLGEMLDEESTETKDTSYEALIVNRLITNNNFHSKGFNYVSTLENKDVKSITITKADGVDFIKDLPDSFKYGKTAYDITAIKNNIFPDVYKITITLPSTKTDMTKAPTGSSVYDKIYMKNYNAMVGEVCSNITGSFDYLAGQLAEFDSLITMKSSGDLTSTLVVEYYIDASDFTPVAARYNQVFDISFDIKVTDKLGLTKYLTMLQKMKMTSNSYYFFNNSFGIIL